MGELNRVVVDSVANDTAKHTANAVATGGSAAVASFSDAFLGLLPHIAVIVGICVSVAIFYKTYQDIQLNKIRLEKEGRRDEDRTTKTTTLRYNAKDRPKQ